MKPFRFLSIVSVALAGLSAAAATSMALEDRMPNIAAKVGVSGASAKAKHATSLLAAGIVEGPEPQIALNRLDDGLVESLSLVAYRSEPLSVDAIRNLGLLAHARGDRHKAASLMSGASNLTRRDLSTNSWLIRDYAAQGNTEGMLRSIDHALRTSSEGRTLLIPRLVKALEVEEVAAPVLALLRGNPDWEQDFWAQAHTTPAALPNIVTLRLARKSDGHNPPGGYDARIMEALVRSGYFAEADRLNAEIAGPVEHTQIVQNTRFDGTTGMHPFAWELFHSADMATRIDPSAGSLTISAYGNREELAARQLVKLPTESLALRVGTRAGSSSPLLSVRLQCAEPNVSAAIEFNALSSQQRSFVRPDNDCEYYWLEIVKLASERMEQREVALSEVAIHMETQANVAPE